MKTYTLNIEREDTRSNDNTLSSLKINDVIVNVIKGTYEYEIELPNNTLKTQVDLTLSNDKAEVSYKDIDLVEGENNLLITVTSENKLKQDYNIKIKRLTIEEEEARKHYLENIVIEGYNFEFDKDVFEYDLQVNKDDRSLKIKVLPEENIDITILNNGNLVNNSKVIIKVKDDAGEKSYTINIHKENNVINYICYGVFGLGVVMFISSIIYVSKKRK